MGEGYKFCEAKGSSAPFDGVGATENGVQRLRVWITFVQTHKLRLHLFEKLKALGKIGFPELIQVDHRQPPVKAILLFTKGCLIKILMQLKSLFRFETEDYGARSA